MSPLAVLRVAIRALLRNKMRSFLTTLGMVIGVGAVIAMVAIGEGAKARVEQSFAAMGSNLIILMPGSTTSGGVRGGAGSQPTLTWDDLKAIQTEVPSVKYAAPVLSSNAQIMATDQNWTTRISGTTPDYFAIRAWSVGSGTMFNQSDIDGATKVVLLGQTVVEKLFGANAEVVGHSVRIKNVPFQIVGVLEKKGQSAVGQDYDDAAFIPVSTFQSKIQGGLQKFLQGTVFIGAESPAATQTAQTEVTALMRERHRLQAGADDDFSIRNLTEMASAQEEGANTLTKLLASIAAVSLLVGGIGIMNIMLVSVTERTREIGVRMAVGAKPYHILAQFLVESLVLATLGGLLGVAGGIGVGTWLAKQSGWGMVVRPDIVIVSVVFSALVGIGFGLYPAHKASRLDPIEALRYE